MAYAQKLILLSLLFISCAASAGDWRIVAGRSGFFGKYSLGANYSPSENHEFEISLGIYPIADVNYAQVNALYRYGYWHIPWGQRLWTPLQGGIFVIYSLDHENFFTTSPGKYPSSGYYDETAYRWGVEFGSMLAFLSTGIEIGYRFRILDNGMVAIYNNGHRDLQYYLSSMVELRYCF